MTDRDSNRFADPLHDTMDETDDDRVVSGVIDPDHTPVHDVVERIAAVVGELGDDAREQLIDVLGAHDKRGKVRAANRTLEAVAVSQREIVAAVDRDLPEWVRRLESRITSAEAKAAVCDEERVSRLKRAKWLNPIRNVGIGAVFTALLWAVRALSQHGADGEVARQRDRQVERNAHDVRELQDRQLRTETILGLRARLSRDEPDRSTDP